MSLTAIAKSVKEASFSLFSAGTKQKNQVLEELYSNLLASKDKILEANRFDLAEGEKNGLDAPLLERLSLENKLEGITLEVRNIIALEDPVGEKFEQKVLENGLHLEKQRTPIGVIGAIYESRPNVTVDISALAIKSGNGALLRGGKEALNTNLELVKIVQDSLLKAGLPKEAVQLLTSKERADVLEMLKLDQYIDVIIPRGGQELQQFCKKNSTIAVITGGIGICHLFVDKTAKQDLSLEVIFNAKTQRPTVCNALDTLLVHESIAKEFIEKVVKKLKVKNVSFRLDKKAFALVDDPSCQLASDRDFDTEWLSLVLGIKVVSGLQEAIDHIHLHSSGHSDGILTEDKKLADEFIRKVDSAAVYVNASTRFTDGGQYGLGAEVAISTQKLHARGPMGLKELTSYKWVVTGDYQVRK